MKIIKKLILVLLCIFLISGCKKKEEPVQEPVDPIVEEPVNDVVEEPEPLKESPYEFYAMFGVDSRGNSYGIGTRSDSLMIIGVNKTDKKIKVASILRDTLAHIEGHNYEKITHAHSYGGPELALDTLNENYDFNIKNYLTVNFNSVGDLVDMIGGIYMYVDSEEVRYINGYIDENNRVRGTYSSHITEPGSYLLDGSQAVAYSRIRYTEGGDFKRSERQRDVIFKIFEAAQNLSNSEKIDIASRMLKTIRTNISEADVLSLLADLSSYEVVSMESYPQLFYAGIIDMNGLDRYCEVPCDLEKMVFGLHVFFEDEAYTELSPTAHKHAEFLASYGYEPNYDTSSSYGNGE